MSAQEKSPSIALRSRATCPRCWHRFPPDECRWISQDPELIGDPRLGKEHQLRFLPTRFTVDGLAIDANGMVCHELACPKCHLSLPRALLEMEPVFCSMLGSPSSGKSYLLAVMTWQLRNMLQREFRLSFGEIEPSFNLILNQYEEKLFFNENSDDLVAIDKTQLEGNKLYDTVKIANQDVKYPRPFVFSLKPLPNHPNHERMAAFSRALCLYDNAGEHFLPGQDTAGSPVTHHLALSRVLFFLFDPTQDPRFRAACRGRSTDPQMAEQGKIYRQETILREAADRVRRYSGLSETVKHHRPLIVLVTKYDAWSALLPQQKLQMDRVYYQGRSGSAVDLEAVQLVSDHVRDVLGQHAPEVVSAAEGFAEQVLYLPVSALGRAPEAVPVPNEPGKFSLCIRPKDIRPMWVELPMIYVLCKWMRGLVSFVRPKTSSTKSNAADVDVESQELPSALPNPQHIKVWKETGS